MFSLQLHCRTCHWRTVCGPGDAASRLRLIGLLRRDKDPQEQVLAELLVDAAPRMATTSSSVGTRCQRASRTGERHAPFQMR